jgi:CheY-like chemotaxis protein
MRSPKARILYIEDFPESGEMISMMLFMDKCDYSFLMAYSPSEALELIACEPFDLYIMDYRLPEMTGVELCRVIRKTDKKTPIMFFTGMALEKDRREALAAGANAYLVKPNDLDRITYTIRELLGKSRNSVCKNQPSCRYVK